MSIAKPFTFVANTYAKASEVNANFDTVYSQVNTNISNIAQNATDIDNLENNKADVNGNASQRFAVADAVTSNDAINKSYLMNAIGNSIDLISGLVITKDSGSPEDTIIVSAGSCYDSTKSLVLSLSDAISKQNDNQGANATYYVYIIGNSPASQTDILISTNMVTPALPTGYSLYRQIGSYTTDNNSHINSITIYSNSQHIQNAFVTSIQDIGNGTTDLSSYLPNDGCIYLIWVRDAIWTSGGGNIEAKIQTDIFPEIIFDVTEGDSGRNGVSGTCGCFPVGTGRWVKIQNTNQCQIVGYMRA